MTPKPRGVYVYGNWKMNHGMGETEHFFQELSTTSIGSHLKEAIEEGRVQGALFVNFITLERARALGEKSALTLTVGVQNLHFEKKGAFTGEISGPMVKEIGIDLTLLGHSERRQYFSETDELICKKAESLLTQGFRIVLCVGETRAERERGETLAVLSRQLDACLASSVFREHLDGRVLLAYEPVWAIGTGLTASPAQAQEAHRFLRDFIQTRVTETASQHTPILYGGSVTAETFDELLEQPDIDGGLIGGASLKPQSFFSLLTQGAKASRRAG